MGRRRKTLGEAKEKMDRGGTGLPHVAEIIEAIVKKFGGAEGFATVFYDTFGTKGISHATKSRMMDVVLRLLLAQSAKAGEVGQFTSMTEEELAEAARYYKRLLPRVPGANPQESVCGGDGIQQGSGPASPGGDGQEEGGGPGLV